MSEFNLRGVKNSHGERYFILHDEGITHPIAVITEYDLDKLFEQYKVETERLDKLTRKLDES